MSKMHYLSSNNNFQKSPSAEALQPQLP